jgi:hypothetical protein
MEFDQRNNRKIDRREEHDKLMSQCDELFEKEFDYNHDWYCGCGHWNGCNLTICALCGRTPSESFSISKEV